MRAVQQQAGPPQGVESFRMVQPPPKIEYQTVQRTRPVTKMEMQVGCCKLSGFERLGTLRFTYIMCRSPSSRRRHASEVCQKWSLTSAQ